MTYQKIYDSLIARARARKLEGYCEKHHIIPRCMGGDNSKHNLVKLTGREHYIVHRLLLKIHKKRRLAIPVIMMAHRTGSKITSRTYEILRKAVAEHNRKVNTGRKLPPEQVAKIAHRFRTCERGPEWCANISKGQKGRKHSESTKKKLSEISANMPQEHRDKIAASLKGRKASEETKNKQRLASTGKSHSEEAKAKMRGPRNESPETKARRSAAKLGFKHSDAAREKMSNSHKNRAPMSEETKRKIGEASRGRKASDETKAKMSIAAMGKPSALRGVPRSEETKAKISAGRKGKKLSLESIAKMSATKRRNAALFGKDGLLTHWV